LRFLIAHPCGTLGYQLVVEWGGLKSY